MWWWIYPKLPANEASEEGDDVVATPIWDSDADGNPDK
jgi:hypothetical protein